MFKYLCGRFKCSSICMGDLNGKEGDGEWQEQSGA